MTTTLTPVADATGAVRVNHAWFPVSPCALGCVDETGHRHAGPILLMLRIIRLSVAVVTLTVGGLLVLGMPRLVRRAYVRRSARMLLGALGAVIAHDDRRPFAGNTRGLVVANHVSYLDVLALATVSPAHFVAKSEVATMPVVSTLARRLGVITVERESLRDLPATVQGAVSRLNCDSSVAVFPEGTTRCGVAMGSFRPAFFQAAIDARVPVLPMRLDFRAGGAVATAPSFIGDDTPLDTLKRVLRMRDLTIVVRLYEPQLPGTDRRELARRCERLVAGTDDIELALAA